MPIKTSKKRPVGALPSIPKELIDQMVRGPMDAEAVNAASMALGVSDFLCVRREETFPR
jgi:hypothetical protein